MKTAWFEMHDFARFVIGQGWITDMAAEYEYFVDQNGYPVRLTGRSRLVPIR